MSLIARSVRPPSARPHRDDAIEPGRLRRAINRNWERLGPHQYRIEGRHRRYYDVNLESDVPCDCVDAQMHGLMCLHRIKALIIEHHPAVWEQVLKLAEHAIEREAAEAKAARKAARTKAPKRPRRTRTPATQETG